MLYLCSPCPILELPACPLEVYTDVESQMKPVPTFFIRSKPAVMALASARATFQRARLRHVLCLAFAAACLPPADSVLVANELLSPQDLATASGVRVCANRSSFCNVFLDVPSSCSGATSACPVLFCLHGFGGSNRKYVELCGTGVHQRSFIGVYPQGDPLAGTPSHRSGFGWNDGMAVNNETTSLRCKYNNFTCTLDPNDGIFFEVMARALRTAGASGHLYAFGQSNGADWVQRLGVNAGSSLPFMGIAPQSGQLNAHPQRSAAGPFNFNQPRLTGTHVAQLSIHGTADRIIPYSGGPKFNSPVFIMYSEPDSDRVWAEHNGCTGEATATNVSAQYWVNGSTHDGVATHHAYNGCPSDAPVEWYETHNAGHVGTSQLADMSVVDVVLAFFQRVEMALLLLQVEQPQPQPQPQSQPSQ